MTKLTPVKAIRAKCLQCSCDQPIEVRLCQVKTCALYPYRMGHRPKPDDLPTETINAKNPEIQKDFLRRTDS